MVRAQSILITGAAGSIGSALLRRLVHERVTGIDLRPGNGLRCADIRDRLTLRRIFEQTRPDVVFHAAALKHVPDLETEPFAAAETNIFGTVNVACAAREAGVRTVVLLSTDKAVRPAGVMGKTKRVAEDVFTAIESTATAYITVRLGNVLGSSGSVRPLFEEQIRRGGPVTVTHRDMERYFLTADAAVDTLIRAAEIGAHGDIIVPQMGAPRSVLDLAKEMIGDRNVPISFIGIRPGEKLSEQLWDGDREELVRTELDLSIYRPRVIPEDTWDRLDAIRRCCAMRDEAGLLALLSDKS